MTQMDTSPEYCETISLAELSLPSEEQSKSIGEVCDLLEPDTRCKIVKTMWIHRFHR